MSSELVKLAKEYQQALLEGDDEKAIEALDKILQEISKETP